MTKVSSATVCGESGVDPQVECCSHAQSFTEVATFGAGVPRAVKWYKPAGYCSLSPVELSYQCLPFLSINRSRNLTQSWN